MKALEVEKWLTASATKKRPSRRYRKGSTWHWLNERDPGRTLCGKLRIEMAVVGEHEIDGLPELEACRGCLRNLEEWARKRPLRDPGSVTLEPSTGRMSKTGPLSHGTRRSRGHRIG